MILQVCGWEFDVDMTATMEYSTSEAEEHCLCGYCRNFYASIDDTYPQIRPFLAQFGVDPEAPDELVPYTPTLYQAYYSVSGKILKSRENITLDNGLEVGIEPLEKVNINTGLKEPCFVISIGLMELPWVLDEAAEDVVSPANEPSFLKKIWNRILGRNYRDVISQ